MTMTRIWLVCVETGHVAFTSEAAAKRAGYSRSQAVLLLDGPIPATRSSSRARYRYMPLAGHGSTGVESPP